MIKARTPLRYPGGKTRAIKQILAQFPAHILEYREPFLGGGSVLLAVKNLFGNRIKRYWVNDINYDLVCFWTRARDDIHGLTQDIQTLRRQYKDGRNLYEYLRDTEHAWTDQERATRFFIMNRITFSGVMDAGGYSQQAFEGRFTDSAIERLSSVAYHLQGVHITHDDYLPLLNTPGEGVFIFMDPPYWSATESRLYGKRGELHTNFKHERLACHTRACQHQWLITYDDSEYIREQYSFADIQAWQLQYGMNNYKQGYAAKGNEIFIRNY